MSDETAPPFLSPPHLQAIGNLVAYWAFLESSIEVAIWCFLNLKRERGALITTHMGLITRVDLLREICRQKYIKTPNYCDPLGGLLDQVESLRIERNNIVHFLWHHDPTGEINSATALKTTARVKLRTTLNQRTATEIHSTTNQVWHFTCELQGLLEAMFPHRKLPWPKTPP